LHPVASGRWRAALAAVGLLALVGGPLDAQFLDRIVATDGAQPAGGFALGPPAISGDGRFVAFVSQASNLLGPGLDTNAAEDVFVADLVTGSVERVSVSTAGVEGNGRSGVRLNPVRSDIGISDDGNVVVFTSPASTLVDGNCMAMPLPPDCDNNMSFDVFVRNRQTGVTTRQNVSQRAGITFGTFPGLDQNLSGTERAAISGDGNYVAFIQASFIPLVDGDADEFGNGEVYLREIDGPLLRASVDLTPNQGIDAIGPLSLSDDGNRLVYVSLSSSLVPGDTNNQHDVFLFERSSGTITRVSVADDETESDGPSRSPVISGDGRYVAFWSTATDLTPPTPNTGGRIYVRDLVAGTTTRIDGTGCLPPPAFGCTGGTTISRLSLSDDGRFLAFDYSGNDMLWPEDSSPAADLYVYDRVHSRPYRISTNLAGGNANFSALAPALTDDGALVAFTSFASDLVGAPSCLMTPAGPTCDTNNQADVFVGSPQVVTPIQSVRNLAPRSDGQRGAALVAHKRLVVRAYPRLPRSYGAPLAAVGKLCIDGMVPSCPPGQFFQVEGQALPFGTELSAADRRAALDSLNFFLEGGPFGLLDPGPHSFEIRITPQTPGAFPEIVRRFDALLNETDQIDIYVYPYRLRNAAMMDVPPDPALLASGEDFTRAVYPVSEAKVPPAVVAPSSLFLGLPGMTPAAQDKAERDLVRDLVRKLARQPAPGPQRRRFAAAVVPDSVDGANPINALGYTYPAVPEAVVTVDESSAGTPVISSTIAHELGHQLGFGEEYCYSPNVFPCAVGGIFDAANPPPRNAEAGDENGTFVSELMDAFDVGPLQPGRKALFHEGLVALRGYMGAGDDDNSWTTGTEYAHLYGQLTRAPAPLVAPATVLRTVVLITGDIQQDGDVALDPLILFQSDGVFPQPMPGSTYTVEFRGPGDTLLGSQSFDVSFLRETLDGEDSQVTEEDEVPFALYFDLPDGTVSVRLREGGTPLAQIDKSANPPTVDFVDATLQAGNVLDLEWMGSDQDGDDLTYTLLYSPDGVLIEVLAVDLDTTTFSFDLDEVAAAGFGAFVRVIASDGWNAGQDDHPLGPQFAVLDVDADGVIQPLTDGLLVLRHLFGFTGGTLIGSAVGGGCTRCVAADITTYLNGLGGQLDIDLTGGSHQALTDGLLVLRYLFGFTGNTLTNNATGAGCARCDAAAIVNYLNGLDY
jgi:Tol biopolymer transport system component